MVDDCDASLRLTCLQLGAWGMDVEGAKDSQSALDHLNRAREEGRPFDVAIIDHVMPGMNGLMLSSEIKTHEEFVHTKLVLATSSGIEDLVDVIDKAGFAGCVQKPIRQSALLDAIIELSDTDVLSAEATNESAGRAPEPTPDVGPKKRLRVLVAEDNEVSRQVSVAMLLRAGHTVDTVSDGVETVEAVNTKPYDVVLMDVNMPKLDGMGATKQIRALDGDHANVPIIAVTANAMIGDREQYLAGGMNDYISKPIDPEALSEALHRCTGTESAAPTPPPQPKEMAAPTPEVDADDVSDLLAYLDGIGNAEGKN